MKNIIIENAISIHKIYRLKEGNVSAQTKSAINITNEWQKKCKVDSNIRVEACVSPNNYEKIDVVDLREQTAYELKVSGKNSHHEFYKDLIKVLTYNCNNDKPIKNFVFLTESDGIENINKRFTKEIKDLIESKHKIEIILKSIN